MNSPSKSQRRHAPGTPLRRAHGIAAAEDPYGEAATLPEPALCPRCHAVFQQGRWQWLARPAGAHELFCPACRRVLDRSPAGIVTIEGEFARSHRDEVLDLVKRSADRAAAEHALQRVITSREDGAAIVITTTGTQLARGIGEALQDAYRGELTLRFEQGQQLVRVHWKR